MIFRADLVIEATETITHPFPDISQTKGQRGSRRIMRVRAEGPEGAKQLNKEIGSYVTLEMPLISDTVDLEDECQEPLRREILALLPEEGLVLVTGLGNRQIMPDAPGSQTAARILATWHIKGELTRVTGLTGLCDATVIIPGMLGDIGFEVVEFLQGICKQLHPSAVVVIGTPVACSLVRLGCTVQLSDTGASPGKEVGNLRPCIDRYTMSVPVIGIGVPTMVDAEALMLDSFGGDRICAERSEEKPTPRGARMMIMPREIDLLISGTIRMLAMGINRVLNPNLSVKDLTMLTTP